MRYGFGRHLDEVIETAPENLQYCLKVLYAAYLTYPVAIGLIRISVGLFYKRLFSIAVTQFERQVHINTTLNVVYIVTITLLSALECRPVSAFWDRKIPNATCFSALGMQLGSVIPSVLLDLIVLLLPMPIIWQLQMSVAKKGLLIGTFFLGYSVAIISVGRLLVITRFSKRIEKDVTCKFH